MNQSHLTDLICKQDCAAPGAQELNNKSERKED